MYAQRASARPRLDAAFQVFVVVIVFLFGLEVGYLYSAVVGWA
jgi:hypothetical protein